MSNGYLQDSGLGRDTVLDLVDRVAALEAADVVLDARVDATEAALNHGAVVARISFTLTGTGAANSFTTASSDNLSIVQLSTTGVDFQFGSARPNIFYKVDWANANGGTNAAQGSQTAETTTTFSVVTFNAAGVAQNPRNITGEVAVAVIHTGV